MDVRFPKDGQGGFAVEMSLSDAATLMHYAVLADVRSGHMALINDFGLLMRWQLTAYGIGILTPVPEQDTTADTFWPLWTRLVLLLDERLRLNKAARGGRVFTVGQLSGSDTW